jgi:hypothetical protein
MQIHPQPQRSTAFVHGSSSCFSSIDLEIFLSSQILRYKRLITKTRFTASYKDSVIRVAALRSNVLSTDALASYVEPRLPNSITQRRRSGCLPMKILRKDAKLSIVLQSLRQLLRPEYKPGWTRCALMVGISKYESTV